MQYQSESISTFALIYVVYVVFLTSYIIYKTVKSPDHRCSRNSFAMRCTLLRTLLASQFLMLQAQ